MIHTDVAIIGAGVAGACIARTLSAYRLDVCMLDKECDVSFGTSKANSGIIHGGFHHPRKYLKARLELQGNLMYDRLQRELDFPFKRCGIVVAAMSDEEMKYVQHLYAQGLENGSLGLELCSRERVLALEPKLNGDVVGGLYAPSGGIVEPYRFVFSVVESAQHNGVEVLTDFKVVAAEAESGSGGGSTGAGAGGSGAAAQASGGGSGGGAGVSGGGSTGARTVLHAEDGRAVSARYVVNAAGLFADQVSKILGAEEFEITPRKGEYYLLDRATKAAPERVLFPVPTQVSKGMLVIPTVEGTVLVGPTADPIDDKDDASTNAEKLDQIFDSARRMVPSVSTGDVITSFAGLRPTLSGNDFYIDISERVPNLIQVAGIQSPGLTAAPAIGEYVKELLKRAGCELTEKSDYDPFVTKLPRFRDRNRYDTEELIQSDPAFANIVCRCEEVSEAEIRAAIARGHTTLDGVKYFTRAGMGRCQGGFCTYKIIKTLMEETGMSWDQVTKRGGESRLLADTL
jgi:glycerol-3-phosphate dehydrogenase